MWAVYVYGTIKSLIELNSNIEIQHVPLITRCERVSRDCKLIQPTHISHIRALFIRMCLIKLERKRKEKRKNNTNKQQQQQQRHGAFPISRENRIHQSLVANTFAVTKCCIDIGARAN